MLIFGIDPGVTTGLALYDDPSGVVFAEDTQAPSRVYAALYDLHQDVPDKAVVVESYVGAGPRTQEAVYTIKVLGFVEFLCQSWGMTYFAQAPQQRKHQVANAERLLPDGPHHAKDALAHALAFCGVELV
jgi:hypothetical protein